jgi:hypothetical protein
MTTRNNVPVVGFGEDDNPAARTTRGKTMIYFIGYKLGLDAEGRLAVPLLVQGREYHMPPIGQGMEVDSLVASHIASYLRVYDPKVGFIDGVTTDATLAASVAAAFFRGALTVDDNYQHFTELVRDNALRNLTDEQLQAEIARRQNTPAEDTEKKPAATRKQAAQKEQE